MDTAVKFLLPGSFFLLTLATGVWLSHASRPLNTALFTLHKLIALAVVILIAIPMYQNVHNVEIQTSVIALIAVSGVCVLALFATGALLSREKPINKVLLGLHQAAPVLAVLSVVLAVYLLNFY